MTIHQTTLVYPLHVLINQSWDCKKKKLPFLTISWLNIFWKHYNQHVNYYACVFNVHSGIERSVLIYLCNVMWLGITALSTVLAIYNILFGIRIWRKYLVLVCYVLEMSHDRSWVSNLSKVYYGRMCHWQKFGKMGMKGKFYWKTGINRYLK